MPNQDAEFFSTLARTKQYKETEKFIAKILLEQWNDVLLSGFINEVFARYKDYFVKPHGVKIVVNKAVQQPDEDQEVRNIEELKRLENEQQGKDKFMVGETALKMAPFLLFLNRGVDKNMKSFGSYYNSRSLINDYLKQMANKGGQSIIDKIPTPKPITFRLSNKDLKAKITGRVNELIKGLDKVTKKNLANEIARGISLKENKSTMLKRLQNSGIKIADYRAKRIIATETESIAEYTQYETAIMNGVSTKTWLTSGSDRVCPICMSLDGQTVPIKENFKAGGMEVTYAPLHVYCQCHIEYDISGNLANNYIKSHRSIKEIYDSFFKAKDDSYKPSKTNIGVCVNPNNVWAGGESNVGADKNVGNLYEEIKGVPDFMLDRYLELAREQLTDEGYVQLRLKLGLTGKIVSKK